MADLLLHSLAEFAPLIESLLDAMDARTTVEIGVEDGPLSHALTKRARMKNGVHVGIDPEPQRQAASVFVPPHGVLYRATSIEVLPALPAMDAYMIDGDHNYHTVSSELSLIAATSEAAGSDFPLVVLHDVGWPCARRDQYYNPDLIPVESRHPNSFRVGVRLGDPAAWVERGFRGNGAFAYALSEGGPQNGVLTAVEDFLARKQELLFYKIPSVFGVGFIIPPRLIGRVEPLLRPYVDNPFLAKLEINRLQLYLRVLDLQDERNARPSP